ncbi:hypothetical protein Emtol_4197 [Emticicia oligotrophica DSM 17448]|uniref:Energy transducer TonB n=1 Tax=Emticicia oligotrophica (strain DSM 17448 / CIP 109782 / MTCC 6937 / GPTSA100-15) TaxID=929562 RepID=A0ABN4ATN6_EMTOG|nr:hypothetical protein [Emticicia oligotrophica]AFK05321.1 hypothetical protein Emtol_4197 [Emticicia oligotrophica DSM 17448]
MQSTSIENEEKSNQTTAFFMTLVIYSVFLGLLYFFKLMYTPPEDIDGVELNYGIDLVGSGDIQTTNKANISPNNYDVKPSEKSDDAEAKPLKTKPIVVPPAEKVEKLKVKETATKPVVTTDDEKSPITEKVNNKPPKKEVVKPVEKANEPKVKSTPVKNEPIKTEPPKRTVEDGSLMKKGGSGTGSGAKSNSNSNGTIGTRDGIGGNNNGDGKKGEVGDKGDPRGTLDGKSMMGKPGNGNGNSGASIGGLSGWNKRKLSLPDDGSSETGKIVFKVTVDDSGDVVGISVVSSTVSPSVQNFYKNYIQQKLSSVLSPEGTPPPRATGTITINIQSGN